MNKVQHCLIDEIEQSEESLSEWERRFINNLEQNYSERDLSEAQNAVLNKIYKKAVFEY